MLARRSLILLVLLLAGSAALAQVPGLGVVIGGIAGRPAWSAWNPGDAGGSFSFSNSNLTASVTSQTDQIARATTAKNAGKWYFEITVVTLTNASTTVGIATSSAVLGAGLGYDTYSYGYSSFNGNILNNGAASGYGGGYNPGDVVGVAVDLNANRLYIRVNSTWQNSANPGAGTGGFLIVGGRSYFPAVGLIHLGNPATISDTLNVGKTAFANSAPSGFSAWH